MALFRRASSSVAALVLLLSAVACGSSSKSNAGANAGSGNTAGSGAVASGGATNNENPVTIGIADGTDGTCLAANFLHTLGEHQFLIGGSVTDATAKVAPFDIRYLYISGGFNDGSAPCASCASGCSTQGTTCANSGKGCAWWGCWQYDQDPPGAYVRGFVATAQTNHQIPMITLYTILQASGAKEGAGEVTAVADVAFMSKYFAQFRFLLQQLGSDVALLHLEPDFWGYAQQVNADPAQIPAAVATANAMDCGSQPNTITGFASCLVDMTHHYATKTKGSLHGSGWATGMDALSNNSAALDVAGEAQKLAAFLKAAAPDADFITIDASDRDAGWYKTQNRQTFWDATNATLPNFKQAFTWSKALAEAAQKPVLWWQVPVGNMSLPNKDGQWQDNRLDYFFAHLYEAAAADAFGVAFGAGAGGQTTFETDGGHGISLVEAYAKTSGQAPCH